MFPQWLNCCRTGPYHLLATIQHRGNTPLTGHYVATCWLGDERYVEYDDDVVSPKTWDNYMASEQVQREVYVLMYVLV